MSPKAIAWGYPLVIVPYNESVGFTSFDSCFFHLFQLKEEEEEKTWEELKQLCGKGRGRRGSGGRGNKEEDHSVLFRGYEEEEEETSKINVDRNSQSIQSV